MNAKVSCSGESRDTAGRLQRDRVRRRAASWATSTVMDAPPDDEGEGLLERWVEGTVARLARCRVGERGAGIDGGYLTG
jgi:hypothetical protein